MTKYNYSSSKIVDFRIRIATTAISEHSQKLRRLLIDWPHLPHDFMLILLIETITEEVCNTFFDNFTKILRGHLRAGAPSFEWTILLLTVHMQLFELVSMPF